MNKEFESEFLGFCKDVKGLTTEGRKMNCSLSCKFKFNQMRVDLLNMLLDEVEETKIMKYLLDCMDWLLDTRDKFKKNRDNSIDSYTRYFNDNTYRLLNSFHDLFTEFYFKMTGEYGF